MKYCTVCRSRYRGSAAVHASTAKHRRNLHGGGRTHRGDLDRALGFGRVNVRRALAGGSDADMERVRKHRRSPPYDGTRRTVPVRRYWRHRTQRWFSRINASGQWVRERVRALV